ncbi:MAG: sulfite exporter TauE/SafE family protein [Promethearchaeota archaeon]
MELIWELIIVLLIIGFIIGAISTIAGIGGGVMIVSILTVFFFMPINEAIDTSTFVILISSGAGFIMYLKQGRTELKISLILAGFSILGSLICTIIFLFIKIDNTVLKFIFATVMLITGFNMILKAKKTHKDLKNTTNDEESKEFFLKDYDYKANLKKSIPLFMLAGFLANLIGIGGGVVMVPTLNIVLGYPIHNSTAISTSVIFFTSIFNTIVKAIFGKINYLVGIFVGIGAVVGAIIGAKVSNKMPKVELQILVALVLIILAITMYF